MSDQKSLAELFGAESLDLEELERALDAATHDVRVQASRRLTGRLQARLFDACEGRTVTLEQMVPTSDPLREVIHVGTNTLPAFRHFEKRFCRPTAAHDDGNTLWGYNHNWYWPVTTPGYYQAYVEAGGELWVDYTREVPERVASWPPLMPNERRLGHVVFAGMIDHVRRVSEHVTIGRAFKKKPMKAWFVLVRDDRF